MGFKLRIYNFVGILSVLSIIGLICVIYCILCVISRKKQPPIYCIMITGKDACRKEFAKLSILNFQNQVYPNKFLIIINHGDKLIDNPIQYCKEVIVNKDMHKLCLGELRNIALELVPFNAMWFPWDDDDYRHPLLLRYLMDQMISQRAGCVCMTTRLEYNKATRFAWKMTIKSGMVLVLAKKDRRFQYIRKESMEDVDLIDRYKELGYKVVTVPNNPGWYLRLVHNNNTSMYVNENKQVVLEKTAHEKVTSNYLEENCSDIEASYVDNILLSYYKTVLALC
jgi:hypothetical protein